MKDRKKRVRKIIKLLNRKYNNPKTALNFKTPHQLLVAVILSAQCTDKKVNETTKILFKKYEKIEDYANANIEDFESDIKTIGLFRSKAKYIIESSKIIVKEFHSKVPSTMKELTSLPGVARKTANIVLKEAFGKNEGIAVDTHVGRLSQRLRLSESHNAVKIEKDLMKIVDKKEWGKFSNLLIFHGRKACFARNPRCKECILKNDCPEAKIKSKI